LPSRIPQSFIDELVARADIVEVIDTRVPLRKAGRDYVACCPFHSEKTPSFTVSPAKQFYHCFGCGAHGSVIGFLMEHAGMSFVEAVEELAERTGLEVPREHDAPPAPSPAPGLYEILERASTYYRQQLREHPQRARAVEYLKRRGLGGEIAARYHIGYAPPGWDSLLRALGGDQRARRALLAAGLTIEKEPGRPYARFRDRVVFPIRDRRGRVVGFGGRVLGDETPKYLNSPETAVFHKGQELYGLYEARRAGAGLERLLVVEGYMDVVSLAEHGIDYAVATLGTAATAEHLRRLFQVTPRVVFCFDGDAAGRRAAWRAVETLLPIMRDGWLASFMFLPEGEDPDTLVRTLGREGFEARLEGAVSLSAFLFEHLAAEAETATLEGRARLVELARPLLRGVQAPAFQRLAVGRLAELSGMNAAELTRLIVGGERPRAPAPRRTPSAGGPPLVRRIITLLVHHPELATEAADRSRLAALEAPGVDLLLELLELLARRPALSTGALVEHFREHPSGRHLARLAASPPPALGEGLAREFADAIGRLEEMLEEQRFGRLLDKARRGPLTNEEASEFARLSRRAKPPGDATSLRPGR